MNTIWLIKKLIALMFAIYTGMGVIIIFDSSNARIFHILVKISFALLAIVTFLIFALIATY